MEKRVLSYIGYHNSLTHWLQTEKRVSYISNHTSFTHWLQTEIQVNKHNRVLYVLDNIIFVLHL